MRQDNPNTETPTGKVKPQTLPVGYQLNDYRIESVLGFGGFGITYKAIDMNLDMTVALKEYYPSAWCSRAKDTFEVAANPFGQELINDKEPFFDWGLIRFLTEAKTLARLQHPNVVRIKRFFESNGSAYIVMEYEAGEPLSHRLEERGTLSEGELIRLLRELLTALEAIHDAGFLHRDLKPSNIYINQRYGHVVLLDFGAARETPDESTHTVTNLFSPGYSPPEQYSASSINNGPWSDIYALGAILYYAVTGNKPLDAMTRVAVNDMLPASKIAAGYYNDALLEGIDKALALKPEDRFQTVAGMRDAINSAPEPDDTDYGDDDTQSTTQIIHRPQRFSWSFQRLLPVFLALLAIVGWTAFAWRSLPTDLPTDLPTVSQSPVESREETQEVAETNVEPGSRWRDSLSGLEFVRIPSGCYQMGSPPDEDERGDNEAQQSVCVNEDSGLWFGVHEVSNAQYRSFLTIHGSGAFERSSLDADEQPVVQVSWKDAMAYARWLSAETGENFRLPTEAEWEYAARAQTGSARFWGEDPDLACQYANVHDRYSEQNSGSMDWPVHGCDDGQVVAAAVGSYEANGFGLYDMLGNVWEWTASPYATTEVMSEDGKLVCAKDSLGCFVIRGGSWYSGPNAVRTATRRYLPAQDTSEFVGFRLVRD